MKKIIIGLLLLFPFSALASTTSYLGESCVRYANYLNSAVPLIDAVYFTNLGGDFPVIGGVIVLKYNAKDGSGIVYHVAIIQSFEEDGFAVNEANYHAGKIDYRIISWNDPHIIKFFRPVNV